MRFFFESLFFLKSLFVFFVKLKAICIALGFSGLAGAVKIHFPDEELATESVLPQMDSPKMVLNRNIPLKFRPELGVSVGIGLDEPFYLPIYPTGILAFHISSSHAVSLTGSFFFPVRSGSGEELSQKGVERVNADGDTEIIKLDPLKAPYPQMSAFVNYQYSPFYGKISLAKNWVMNLSIYGFLGLGILVSDQKDIFPAGNFGIGQKLYINKWLGIRGDLGFYSYYGPAVATLNLGDEVRKLSYSSLQPGQKKLIINVLANIGLIVLI